MRASLATYTVSLPFEPLIEIAPAASSSGVTSNVRPPLTSNLTTSTESRQIAAFWLVVVSKPALRLMPVLV